jgi:NTE family protein
MSESIQSRLGRAKSPATVIEPDRKGPGPQPGMALCLSGGGYRAMLFHVGAIIRLNETAKLGKLKRISTVSGGSIVGAMLGLHWKNLQFKNGIAQNLLSLVVEPIKGMASHSIDWPNILKGLLLPGTINRYISRAYDRLLYHAATLQDLPAESEGPLFVINSTSLQSGALWRFTRPYMADYLVGRIPNPRIPLAAAVAASSAFPPFLSPARLKLNPQEFIPDKDCPLQHEPFTTRAVLSDGGVYDNLGLETAWKRCKTVLVSDAGGQMEAQGKPCRDWAFQSFRVLNVIDNQVRSLRKRQAIGAFVDKEDEHDGAYWGIRSDIANYELQSS